MSPSGRVYIGLTSNSVHKRWMAHIHRAVREGRHHPLYNSIRKYGADKFIVDILREGLSKDDAAQSEKEEISALRRLWPGGVMNLSAGGETDSAEGGRIFWERINADPSLREQYIEKLRHTKLVNDHSDYVLMSAANTAWRKSNPREAYKNAYRAIRLARKATGKYPKDKGNARQIIGRGEAAKLRKSMRSRESAKEQWKNRTQEQIADVSSKISAALKRAYEIPEHKAAVAEQLKKAREGIDRKKQAEAASRGQKSWWDEIKRDPERYAEYIAKRKAALLKTLERKKCT